MQEKSYTKKLCCKKVYKTPSNMNSLWECAKRIRGKFGGQLADFLSSLDEYHEYIEHLILRILLQIGAKFIESKAFFNLFYMRMAISHFYFVECLYKSRLIERLEVTGRGFCIPNQIKKNSPQYAGWRLFNAE